MTARSIAAGGPAPYESATRVLTSVLAPAEKRLLVWLAVRMPRWVTSDRLTLLAMGGTGASFALASVYPIGLLLVVVFLAMN